MEHEWIHGSPARARPYLDMPLRVWLDDGSVRTAQLTRETYPYYRLLDCRHPLQNTLLSGDSICAWKPA